MKNVKTMEDIAAIATVKVNELLEKGFIFNFGTMSGSQGDDFKADLVKDDVTYRVRVYSDVIEYDDIEVLEVRRYDETCFEVSNFATLWNKDGEVVESRVWFRMRNRNGYVYTDDAEAFRNAQELHHNRYENKRSRSSKSVIAPEKLIESIRAHRGYKRTEVKDIKRIVRKNNKYTGKITYVVEFKNLVSKTADFTLDL